MSRVHVVVLSLSIAAAGACSPGLSDPADFNYSGGPVRIAEKDLRAMAVKHPSPAYPADEVARGVDGVAVVEVLCAPDGSVSNATVLDAASESIGKAAAAAVRDWTFGQVTLPKSNIPRPYRSKLTFYFRVVNGAGIVLSPDDEKARIRAPSSAK